jgi:hypothetical protein
MNKKKLSKIHITSKLFIIISIMLTLYFCSACGNKTIETKNSEKKEIERYSFYNEYEKSIDINVLLQKLEQNDYSANYKSKDELRQENSVDENVFGKNAEILVGRYYILSSKETNHSLNGDYSIINIIEDSEKAHLLFERSFAENVPSVSIVTPPALYDYVVRFSNVIISGKGKAIKYIAECTDIDVRMNKCQLKPTEKRLEGSINIDDITEYLTNNGYTLFIQENDNEIIIESIYNFINYSDGSLLQLLYYDPLNNENYKTIEQLKNDYIESCENLNIYGITFLYNDKYLLNSVNDKWSEILSRIQ